jgi:hypothetical protein
MGTVFVRNNLEMAQQNRLFWKRVESAQYSALIKMATVNEKESQKIAQGNNFTGLLVSKIEMNTVSKHLVRVLSSAPHSAAIEFGDAPQGRPVKTGSTYSGNWIYFYENPLLKEWVEKKLMIKDSDKANFFLKMGRVNIGEHGFPYGYPGGLRFMELGFDAAVIYSDRILLEELNKVTN